MAEREEDPLVYCLATPSLGTHQGTRNTSQLYHRQESLVVVVQEKGLMPVEHNSQAASCPRLGPVACLSFLFLSAHRHHTATCQGLVAVILQLPMHKILVLGQVLYLPLLGIQPGIIKVERNLDLGVFIMGNHLHVLPSEIRQNNLTIHNTIRNYALLGSKRKTTKELKDQQQYFVLNMFKL